MFALYAILLILFTAAASDGFFSSISAADCVLQVMLTQDWFMELGIDEFKFLYAGLLFSLVLIYICKYRCATNIYK
jgi:hypothetical protein